MEHEPFITVYRAICGWKAVLMVWTEDEELGGFWEPEQTGFFAYPTPEKANRYAKEWAEAEELKYVPV